ncbi:hypothetical protein AC579_1971 [Pseudocercospora musae]|uniref:AB hydrolase-1 domain-containing protein n=1 Tax=Pseudocercospora musae TaxID=113226 RepID=A0A139I8J5_9PEZI|nr:hypothetical protein AC579_1971 [Pseudocercospora musae]
MTAVVTTAAGLLYGCIVLAAALLHAALQKEFWFAPSADEEAWLTKASRHLWSLNDSPEGLSHHFIERFNGTQIHYLAPLRPTPGSSTLLVFVHGFPDSAFLFSRQLRSTWATKAKLVALDLPGCGGSDSLDKYGPNEVLNAVAETIALLKHRYLKADAKARCVLVGHDWGGVVASRIAAETSGLVDHVVTLNSLYPAYAEEQLRGRVSRGSQLISEKQFREGAAELIPVLSQVSKSSYTYMLTLPLPLAKILPRLTRCLIKLAHDLQYKQFADQSPQALAYRLAMSYGPSLEAASEPGATGRSYGKSVIERARTWPPGDWDGRIRLYAEGLLREVWTQPFSGACKPQSAETKTLHFKCPVNIIFGLQDIALDPRIVVDGIEKYFVSNDAMADPTQEKIIRLPDCGHWSMIEEGGVRALDKVLTEILKQ